MFREQQEKYQGQVNRLAELVEAQTNEAAIDSAHRRVLEQARIAYRKGLKGKARDLLLDSNVAAFGAEGMKLELDLLLETGRAKEVSTWLLEPTVQAEVRLGPLNYHMLRVMALAASGGYGEAEEECNQLARSLTSDAQGQEMRLRELMAVYTSQEIMESPFGRESVPAFIWRQIRHDNFLRNLKAVSLMLKRRADVTVLRGLIALEVGDVAEAEIAFREALLLWGDEANAASGGGLDFNGRAAAQGYLEWLK
jgi:hypothetical protein